MPIIKVVKQILYDHTILGITLFPYIFVKESSVDLESEDGRRKYEILITHESIHIKQQVELLVLPFYIWYLIEWCIKAIIYGSWNDGYENISFERESYTNQEDTNYLNTRKFYSFLKYL